MSNHDSKLIFANSKNNNVIIDELFFTDSGLDVHDWDIVDIQAAGRDEGFRRSCKARSV